MKKVLKCFLVVASFMLSSAFTFPKYRDDIFIRDNMQQTMDNLVEVLNLKGDWKLEEGGFNQSYPKNYSINDPVTVEVQFKEEELNDFRVVIGKLDEESFKNVADIFGIGINSQILKVLDSNSREYNASVVTDDYYLTVSSLKTFGGDTPITMAIEFDEESISQEIDEQLSLAKEREAAEELSITQLYKDYPKEWVDAYLQSAISTKGDFIKWFNIELNAYPKEKRSEEIERMLKKNYETQSIIDSQFE